MDHDLEIFPLLSYALHHSDPASHAPPSLSIQHSLANRYPLLTNPHVISTLIESERSWLERRRRTKDRGRRADCCFKESSVVCLSQISSRKYHGLKIPRIRPILAARFSPIK
ncbi:hypothetical protein YC2023_055069 [Brassica napus]